MTMQGPNVKKLIAHKMSMDAVPSGGGVQSALAFLTTPGRIVQSAKAAAEWVKIALQVVREAAEPNPWKGKTDEEIAGELFRQIEEKRRASWK